MKCAQLQIFLWYINLLDVVNPLDKFSQVQLHAPVQECRRVRVLSITKIEIAISLWLPRVTIIDLQIKLAIVADAQDIEEIGSFIRHKSRLPCKVSLLIVPSV